MDRFPRPSPATLIAFAALFVALGGPGQAAQLARNVTHHKHSLRGPRGPRGLPGPQGAAGGLGPAGAQGPRGGVGVPVVRQARLGPSNDPVGLFATASCNPGEVASGGGVSPADVVPIRDSRPSTQTPGAPSTGWSGASDNPTPGGSVGIVWVLCVPAS